MSAVTSGIPQPACRCAHAGYTVQTRHWEEQSDEAIHTFFRSWGLLRFARKDGDGAACAFINPLLTKCSPDEQSDIRDSSTPHVAALIRATPSKTRHCEAQSDEAIHT